MSNVYEVIHVEGDNKEIIEAFISEFKRAFKAEGGFYDVEENNEKYEFNLEGEPIFSIYEDGDSVDYWVVESLRQKPSNHVEATFSNGDGIYVKYVFDNGELMVRSVCDNDGEEREGMEYCEECDAEFDPPIFTLEDFDENKKYTCPECGADLLEQFKPEVIVRRIKLDADMNWIFTEEFKKPKCRNRIA